MQQYVILTTRTTLLLSCSFLLLGLSNCRKQQPSPEKTVAARIIGFDQCDQTAGRVLVLENPRDTVVTYTLPTSLYTFPAREFGAYTTTFLFPAASQDAYKVNITYRLATQQEKKYSLCAGNINVQPFNRAVRDNQIVIIKAERR